MESEHQLILLEDVGRAGASEAGSYCVGDHEQLDNCLNPWPHIKKFFVFESRDKTNDNALRFTCVLCQPKATTIRAHTSSLHNLKSHIRRNHPAHANEFDETVKTGSSRGKHKQSFRVGTSKPPGAKRSRQTTADEARGRFAVGHGVRQSAVDARIVELFVCNMLPMDAVESPSFKSLIQTLNPSKESMSCSTLSSRISDCHRYLEENVKRLLEKIPWVATSADCWSVHNRSYLGVTVHWLDPKTRSRRHAFLGCCGVRRLYAPGVFTEAVAGIHRKFQLQEKVTKVTSDNGRNFAKAFVQFNTEAELLPYMPEYNTNADVDNVDLEIDHEARAADEVRYITVDEYSGQNHLSFPIHMRCAAHTLNLVASVDADRALDSSIFKSAYTKAMSKACALWNQQIHSAVSADLILGELGMRLAVPHSATWDSVYDSVVVLNDLLRTKRGAMHRVMAKFNLKTFTDSEISFFEEYAEIMRCLAKALEKIQGEDQAYLGCLLPTVAAAATRLKEARKKALLFCSPLADAMLEGIRKRFDPFHEDMDCLLAAAFHPKFRLFWLENHNQLSEVKQAMEAAVETALLKTSQEGNDGNTSDEEDDFFRSVTQPQDVTSFKCLRSKAATLVKTWLESGSKAALDDAAFMGEKVLIDLFIRYNTAIPSSAAIERLFLLRKDIVRAKRAALSDSDFERLIFLNSNHNLLEATKTE